MIFETVAQLKLATLTAGQLVSTKGYYAAGDGGAADYIVAATQAVDGHDNHALAGGTVALLQGKREFDTFAKLLLLRPEQTGQSFICQERANAKYILQVSGYVALAGDVTFANGRVGALQDVGSLSPSAYGGRGDDSTDDTASVEAWLSRGGGVGTAGIFLIDKIVATNDINIKAESSFVLKAKSIFDTTTQEGLIEVNGHHVVWDGGSFDGNKSVISTNITSIATNKRKSLLQLSNCTLGTIKLKATNHYSYCFLINTCAGGDVNLSATNSAYLAYLDRLEGVEIGKLSAYNMDNVIDGNLDKFQNVNAHVAHMLRCNNSPVESVNLNTIGTRSGRLFTSATVFYNGFTQSSCKSCPVGSVSVLNLSITESPSTDLPSGCAASTSVLPLSLVSNTDCDIGHVTQSGQATQAIEFAGGGGTIIDYVNLKGNYGRQGVISGSSGIEIHGRSRYQDNVASSEAMLTGDVVINGGIITGFHNGVDLRKGTARLNGVSIYGNRKNGIVLDNNSNSEWSTTDTLRPSLYAKNCDIQYNGFNGIDIVTAKTIFIDGGVVANNAQRSGFTDATTNSQSGSNNIRYDTSGGTVDCITIGDVDYTGNGSESIAGGISYLPMTPSSFDLLPDSRVKLIPVSVNFPDKAIQGMRVTVAGATSSGDVSGWLYYGDLDKWLLEVDNAKIADAWTDGSNITALTGTYTTDGNGIVGAGAALEAEVAYPSFIKSGAQYGMILSVFGNNSGYINSVDAVYDGGAVLTTELSAEAASVIRATATMFQTTSTDEAGLKNPSILKVRRSLSFRDTSALPVGDIYVSGALSVSSGAGTTIVDTSDIGNSVGANRVLRVVMSRPTGAGYVVALFGISGSTITQIDVKQIGTDTIAFSSSGSDLIAIGNATKSWDLNIQQIGTNGD